MQKIAYYISAIIVAVFSTNTYAASAFKNPSINTNKIIAKSATVTQSKPITTINNTTNYSNQQKSPVETPDVTNSIPRRPATTTVKSFNTQKKFPTVQTKPTQPDSSIPDDAIESVTQRVDDLEKQMNNTITEVTETESDSEPQGYITDISAKNNTLTVTKTNALYIPVRNSPDGDITGSAEIYIVR